MDPFSTLGVEARFDLDEKALAKRQRELSLSLHPDRFAGRPAGERRAALGKAIEVNQAYRIVKDPIRRAEALLDRWGMALPEGEHPPASPELLMEMMELREGLGEAAARADLAKIENLCLLVRQQERETRARLAKELAVLSDLPEPKLDVAGAVYSELGALRYLRRFLDEAGAFLDELC